MRCLACNKIMSDRDCSRKSPITGEYYDLCSKCFSTIKHDVEAVENQELYGEDVDYDETSDEEGFGESSRIPEFE